MAWAIGASQPDDWAIGASQPTAAVGANPKGPLHHPLWGALAGPIFCFCLFICKALGGIS